MTVISVVNSEPLLRESRDAGSARRSARGGRRLRRRVCRAAAREAGRNDRQPRELHALHADAPGGGFGDARAAPRRRAAAPDVPARGAAARPGDVDRRRAARSRRSSGRRGTPRRSATSSSSSRSARSHGRCRSRGSPSTGSGFKDLAGAIHLRNHVLRELEAADAAIDRAQAAAHLTFVFVGAGYAGVEALAELSDLVKDALR